DVAAVLWQGGDRLAILIVELNFQRVEVRLLAFRPLRLGNGDYVVLIEKPRDRDLGGREAMLVTDPLERFVISGPTLRQRRISGQRDFALAQISKHRRFVEKGMVFD